MRAGAAVSVSDGRATYRDDQQPEAKSKATIHENLKLVDSMMSRADLLRKVFRRRSALLRIEKRVAYSNTISLSSQYRIGVEVLH